MATLYEMTEAARELYALLESDEIDEQIVSDTLEAMGASEKLESYCKLIRQFEADEAAYKAEKERLDKKRRIAANAQKRLKEAILGYMQETNEKKINAGTFTLSISHSQAVNVIDLHKIPAEYLKFKEPEPDKVAIKKAIGEGEVIAGVELLTNTGVRIK